MNKRERMNKQIVEHGENLNTIFGLNEDPDKLARRVHRIELKARKIATDYCNGDGGYDSENIDGYSDKILDSLDKVLGFRQKNIPVFFNLDPRGYSLKIDDEWMRKDQDIRLYRDWGGYGILAPDFDGKE